MAAAALIGVGLGAAVLANPISNWISSTLSNLLGDVDTSANPAAQYLAIVRELEQKFNDTYMATKDIQFKIAQADMFFRDENNMYKDAQMVVRGKEFEVDYSVAKEMYRRARTTAMMDDEEINRLQDQFREIHASIEKQPPEGFTFPLAQLYSKTFDDKYIVDTFGSGVDVKDARVITHRQSVVRNLVYAINELQAILETLQSNADDLRRVLQRVVTAAQVVKPKWDPNSILLDVTYDAGAPAGGRIMSPLAAPGGPGGGASSGFSYSTPSFVKDKAAATDPAKLAAAADQILKDMTAHFMYAQNVVRQMDDIIPKKAEPTWAIIKTKKGRFEIVEVDPSTIDKVTETVKLKNSDDKVEYEEYPSKNKNELEKKKNEIIALANKKP